MLPILDQLLNGAYGIRARFASSASDGKAATQLFCCAVADAFASNRLQWNGDKAFLDRSLRLPSAKVWYPTEIDNPTDDPDPGSVTCTLWTNAEPNAVFDAISTPTWNAGDKYRFSYQLGSGRRMPKLAALNVKGAWIEPEDGTEFVTPDKVTRAEQIHLIGWS